MRTTAPDSDLLLSRQACFALYAASRAVTDAYRPLLADLDLTYPQYLVLLVLWEEDPRTVRDVVDALALDYGTVSPLLKRLETRGLVVRRRSAADERTVEIYLTAEGRALHGRVQHVPSAIGCAMGLTEDERAELIGILRTVAGPGGATGPDRPTDDRPPARPDQGGPDAGRTRGR